MTLPRRILKGTTYLLTRRCFQRSFFLRPSKKTNQIFMYCLAYAAKNTGVLIHAYCVMSNHHHIVLTDPDGYLPKFTGLLHKLTAKCINASLGRWEILWSSEQSSHVFLEEDSDVLDKMVYTICNPVSSFLVDHIKKWPGLCSKPKDFLKSGTVVKRPKVFFSEKGNTPEEITFKLTRPKIYTNLDDAEFVELMRVEINKKQNSARNEAESRGILFMGTRRVMKQNPFNCPRTIEPRRNMKPRVAAKNKWRRIEALRRLKSWVHAYREAWKQWKAGIRDVVFPPGTYALVQYSGVICTEP